MISKEIKKLLEDSLETLKKEGSIKIDKMPDIKLEHPAEADLGDYATNISLIIAKKENKTPSEIAGLIIAKFKIARLAERERGRENLDFLDNVQEAGGFINFFISKEYLAKELVVISKKGDSYGSKEIKKRLFRKKKKILVEYSSPNIAKSFGIGHLRSTIIGQAIYNMYKFLGWETIGINHLGDWGTPHGKIIYQLVREGIVDDLEKLNKLTVVKLEKLYIDFNKQAVTDPRIEEGARQWFKHLEGGDNPEATKTARRIWKHIREISLKEFKRIYDLLGVEIDNVVGESFYEYMLEDIVKECKDKKITRKSQGAWIVEFSYLPPAMILKSDGATTYFTRDLAVIKYRIKKYSPELLIYEVGVEQTLHFKQVFEAARMIGWIKDEKFVHVAHGLYRGKHGKFSTRSGDTIHLEDILKEAMERARSIIEKSDTARGLSESEKDEVAEAVGIGSVKYNDLSHNPRGDIIFDWDKILNLKGNSAPYIQYTYARCQSILHKSKPVGIKPLQDPLKGLNPYKFFKEEIDILRFIYRFPEIVQESAEKFSPNLLCSFVFDLSQKFNLFYGARSVLGAESEEAREFRILLTKAVAQVIHNSLALLGIKSPDRL